jgi:hypothetical protein
MFAQLVWVSPGRICYSVQQPDGSCQLVWNASPEQLSQYTVITNKPEETQEDTNLFASSNKTEISPWLW